MRLKVIQEGLLNSRLERNLKGGLQGGQKGGLKVGLEGGWEGALKKMLRGVKQGLPGLRHGHGRVNWCPWKVGQDAGGGLLRPSRGGQRIEMWAKDQIRSCQRG